MQKPKLFNDENQTQKVNNVNSEFTKKMQRPKNHIIQINASPIEYIYLMIDCDAINSKYTILINPSCTHSFFEGLKELNYLFIYLFVWVLRIECRGT